jgi:putative PIN family toxin of toxin-antitoxin system
VVIDTQIFLRAAISRKSLIAKIIFELNDQYHIIYSNETKAEVRKVLYRPALRIKFQQLTNKIAETILTIFDKSERVDLPENIPNISRDTKDNIFLLVRLVGKLIIL